MVDQLLEEAIPALHPDTLIAEQTTAALSDLVAHYAGEHPARFWATMVSSPLWREDRPAMIRALA